MADNYVVKDGNNVAITIKSKETSGGSGIQTPQSIPSDASGSPYTAALPFPVQSQTIGVTTTNVSGTVATGGTFQTVMSSDPNRKGGLIQNPGTATEPLYVYFGATGSATLTSSVTLAPGQSLTCAISGSCVATDNIAVTAATTGHAFVAWRQV